MKRILLLDNHDSFTFILRETFLHAGVDEVQVVKIEDFTFNQVSVFDAMVISPGPGVPQENNLPLIIQELATKIPVLGICLGMQAIAEAFGGELLNLKELYHGAEAQIEHKQSNLFKGIPSPFTAALYHSWAVNEHKLPAELKATALSDKGIIMSLEHEKYPICGVQFHPESHISKFGKKLLSNYLNYYL